MRPTPSIREHTLPTWLQEQIGSVNSPSPLIEMLSSRRGATTFTVKFKSGKVAVKLAEVTEDKTPANIAGIIREYAALSSVPELNARFQPNLIEHGDNVALTEKWIEGTPTFRNVSRLVDAHDEASLLDLLNKTLRELATLHASGWVHGDLQPLHFVDTGKEAVLLDYGVAQSPDHPMPDYKGGMVHFNAPEIAAQVISRGHATATPMSDIFSLGSVFSFCILSEVIGQYGKSDSWQQKQEALARGDLKLDVLGKRLLAMRVIRDLLFAFLAIDPVERPADARAALDLLSAHS